MLNCPLMKVLVNESEVIVRVTHDNISLTDAKTVAFHYVYHRSPTAKELSSAVALIIIRDVPKDVVDYIRLLPKVKVNDVN